MTTPETDTTKSQLNRETAYRVVSAIVMALFGVGVLTSEEMALWTQLAVAAVTLVFAIFYSTSNVRTALYAITGPVAAILGAYGIWQNVDWAIITAAVANALGIATAAAKTVQGTGRHALPD